MKILRIFSCCRRKEGRSWFEADEGSSRPISSPVHSLDSTSDKGPLNGTDGEYHQTLVEEYEDCLRRYELLEMDFMARGGERSMVIKLNENPHCLDEEAKDGNLTELIYEAKLMNDLESKLRDIRHVEGEGEIFDDWVGSTEGKSKTDTETQDIMEENDKEGEEITRKSTSVGATLIKKLKRIDATQGTLSMSMSTHTLPTASTSTSSSPEKKRSIKSSKNMLFVKQKWPEWLVDESYEVVKVTKFGIKYNRILKLTQYHVLACSDNKGVTKVYSYLDLVDIRVLVESSEEERVTLVFKTSNSSSYAVFNYLTPMASIIANQITTRVKIRRTLKEAYSGSGHSSDEGSDKMDLRTSIVALDPAVTDNVLKRITSANTKSKTSAIMAFAECLVENLVPSKNETDLKGDRSSLRDLSASRASVGYNSGSHSRSGGESHKSSDSLAKAAGIAADTGEDEVDEETLAQYLIVVKRNSPEYYVQRAVNRVLLHGASAEHDTRAHFLNAMRDKGEAAEAAAAGGDGGRAARAVMKEARMFIEGMHEYILLKRGPSLATIHVWGAQLQSSPLPSPSQSQGATAEAVVSDNIPPLAPPGSSPVSSSGRQKARRSPSVLVQEQISAEDLDRILDRHLEHQRETKEAAGEGDGGGEGEKYNPLTHLRYHTLLGISYIAYSVVEESIFAELKPNLVKLIRTTDNVHGRDALLTNKIRTSLCQRDQADWGIPESNQSPLGWEVSINELNTLDQHNTPSTKLGAIVVAAKNIFAEYATVKGDGADAIGADDLVPIFIYILAQTNLENILETKELLWNLCHPSLLHGESGYYLTVFESAASFLEECEQ